MALKTAFTILGVNALAFAFLATLYLSGASVGGRSWLDLPAFICGRWLLFGVPVTTIVAASLLSNAAVRETRAGRIGIASAALVFGCWLLFMLSIITATSREAIYSN